MPTLRATRITAGKITAKVQKSRARERIKLMCLSQRSSSNRSAWITRNWRRRFVGLGIGLVGTALRTASMRQISHTGVFVAALLSSFAALSDPMNYQVEVTMKAPQL
jgi:hypothetical protein